MTATVSTRDLSAEVEMTGGGAKTAPVPLTVDCGAHILMCTSGSSSVVEHLLPKQRVASSTLVSRSNLNF